MRTFEATVGLSFLLSLVVEVNFHTASYSVLESDGHVNVYLRITGKFFIPVYATIEINEGTATRE